MSWTVVLTSARDLDLNSLGGVGRVGKWMGGRSGVGEVGRWVGCGGTHSMRP